MQNHLSLCGLIIIICFLAITVQDDSKNAQPSQPAQPETPVPVAPPAPPVPVAAAKETSKINKPESSNSSPASKCKPTEILSENGCVDREYFLNRIVMRSWKDDGFEKAKEKAGLVDNVHCNDDEVRTPFGCSNPLLPPHRESKRVDVRHSSLNGGKVMISNFGLAGRSVHHEKVASGKEKRAPYSGPPISGHNIHRKNYILPGRLLRTGRKCRPYETLGKDGQCHRKQGKEGHYKHRNHVYGLQKRHHHEAHRQSMPNEDIINIVA
ncbi:uncharacterized protein LOC108037395 [Drosophila rhopaloa]|uniref:Uncharacterized protein LOC108037395 n=1 Tax=Drosophila rhopaloa TaxID=1041015 RepID=A0A6P4E7M2_DRORH|nr:uncharacterized protein LOC108037395 [Drosophila rhopaloa]